MFGQQRAQTLGALGIPTPAEFPVVDVGQVQRQAPDNYCQCHFRSAAYANGHLSALQALTYIADRPVLAYPLTAGYLAFAALRLYPCVDCWFGPFLRSVQEGRKYPLSHGGRKHPTAMAALESLWHRVTRDLEGALSTTEYQMIARSHVKLLSTDFELPLTPALTPHLAPDADELTSSDAFARHTLLALDATRSALADWLGLVEKSQSIRAEDFDDPDRHLVLRETLNCPTASILEIIKTHLAEADLGTLAGEVEAELGRAACRADFGPKRRCRPQEHVHHGWQQQREKGLSWGQIAKIASTHGKKVISPSTVRKAVKRRTKKKK
jgi:hypothetical protein